MRFRNAKSLHAGDEVEVRRDRHGAPDYEGVCKVSSVEVDRHLGEVFLDLEAPDGQLIRRVSHVHVL